MRLNEHDLQRLGAVYLAILVDYGEAKEWPPELVKSAARMVRRNGGGILLQRALRQATVDGRMIPAGSQPSP